jgi:hypothetical protein
MIVSIKIIGPNHSRDHIPGGIVDQEGAQNRLLGLDRVRGQAQRTDFGVGAGHALKPL